MERMVSHRGQQAGQNPVPGAMEAVAWVCEFCKGASGKPQGVTVNTPGGARSRNFMNSGAGATRDAAGAILATDEPKARWAWPSSKKSGPRMPFLAAYLPRLSEVYSRTYECRASFRPATRGMVEVSADAHLRMTPFTKTGACKAISTKCYTFSLFQSRASPAAPG